METQLIDDNEREAIVAKIETLVALSLEKYRAAEYSEALDVFQEILQLQKSIFAPSDLVFSETYTRIASAYLQLENEKTALTHFALAQALHLEANAVRSEEYASILYHSAMLNSNLSELDKALLLAKQAKTLYTKLFGKSSQYLAETLYEMAHILVKLKHLDKAAQAFKQAIVMLEAIEREDKIILAECYFHLGVILLNTDKYAKSVAILKKLVNSPSLLDALEPYKQVAAHNFLITGSGLQRDLEGAELNTAAALAFLDSFKTTDYYDAASIFIAAGMTYKDLNLTKKSMEYYKQAIEQSQKQTINNYSNLVNAYMGLAMIYIEAFQYNTAFEIYKKGAFMVKKHLSDDNFTTQNYITTYFNALIEYQKIIHKSMYNLHLQYLKISFPQYIKSDKASTYMPF